MSDSLQPNDDPGLGEAPIPKAVVGRLSLYLRELQRLVREGHDTISSSQLGDSLGFSDAQVRKDLANFGQFGHPGVGYRCDQLIAKVKQILGTDRSWPVALVGIGNLGRALLRYRGFEEQGFRVVAAFDVDPAIVGRRVEGLSVQHLDSLTEVVAQESIRLAILAVPAAQARGVAEKLVAAGIEGVLNFAPVTLSLPSRIRVHGVDLAIELEQLAFAVVNPAQKT